MQPLIRRRQWHPTPVLLYGKSRGWRSLVGCSPWCRWESDTTEWLPFHFSLSCIGAGNGNPLQCYCLENPRDRGACWASVCGVAQGRTRLTRLSSSSLLSRELLMRQFSNHFWYTLNWRNFTTLCEKWLFEKVQLYSCLFCLTSFCQLIHRNCILQALTRENSSDLIFISCDMESCHFLLQPLFDLVYFWRQCLSDVLSSFWEEQHGYSFHICLRDL